MVLRASLDIGSEKTVMALATEENGTSRLTGIKMIASQGVKNGVVTDKAKMKSYVQYLLRELAKDKRVDTINVALGGDVVKVRECKVNVAIQKKIVRPGDISRAESKCIEEAAIGGQEEMVDIIPVSYILDRGDYVMNPIGMSGRNLDIRFRIYTANAEYLTGLRNMFTDCGIEEVNFSPSVRACMDALDVYNTDKCFALADIGASHIGVMLFKGGMLVHEANLPVGVSSIDADIMCAFPVIEDLAKAKKLKHTHGVALRSECKNVKIEIPEAKKQIEKRDLAKVIQCRMEELMEGLVFQLQRKKFNLSEDVILLTGGGARLVDTNVLLNRLSGHKIGQAKAKGIAAGDDILEAPACLIALGLLRSMEEEEEEEEGGLGKWFSGIFK